MSQRDLPLLLLGAALVLWLVFGNKSESSLPSEFVDNSMSEEYQDEPALKADPSVTPALFKEWRSPREGKSNPERMNNPVWEWLIRTPASAYSANELMQGPDAVEAGPGWCFRRFGKSITPLPDGRRVYIAGEHEDHYDADFYIYNDVVVEHPGGHLDIFGYPRSVFAPTDFHTATLVGDEIIIIGSLGYPEERKFKTTQVYVLNLKDFSIRPVSPTGNAPGWIHRHQADLTHDGSAIIITKGEIDAGEKDSAFVENIDDWKLHLKDWRWERLTERKWQQWEVARQDSKTIHLFQYSSYDFEERYPRLKTMVAANELKQPTLEEQLGTKPRLDLFRTLYSPAVKHTKIPDGEDAFRVRRIKVDDVVVRYVDDMYSIRMIVEGNLPQPTIDALVADLKEKLSGLENTACIARRR